jgi:hypothetical protein
MLSTMDSNDNKDDCNYDKDDEQEAMPSVLFIMFSMWPVSIFSMPRLNTSKIINKLIKNSLIHM